MLLLLLPNGLLLHSLSHSGPNLVLQQRILSFSCNRKKHKNLFKENCSRQAFLSPSFILYVLLVSSTQARRPASVSSSMAKTFHFATVILSRQQRHKQVGSQSASVTRKKSPSVYKSCRKMISLEKLQILTPSQKLFKTMEYLGKLIVAKSFKKLPKFQ